MMAESLSKTEFINGVPRAKIVEDLRRVMAEENTVLKAYAEFQRSNRLEFFDKPPNKGPNPKQAELIEAFLNPLHKTLVFSGANRLGKTCILTILALSVMFGKFLWNKQNLSFLFPHKEPRKVRYVGQDWNEHLKSVVVPELYEWWPKARQVQRHGNGIITDTAWLDVESGSTLELMSNRQDPGIHEGWKGDLIVYDEPPRHEIYIANARGLVDRRGREIFAATLLKEAWIDREIIKKVDAQGNPDQSVSSIVGTMYDNVGFGLTIEGVEEFKRKLSDEEVQARIYGIPSYMQGLVYPMFNRKEHIVKQFQVPLNWMVDIAIDVHPRERQMVLFLATDERGDRYVCDEIWEYGDGTQVGEMIVRKVLTNAYRVNRCVIDPLSKGDRNNAETTYQKVWDVLARYDIPLETAVKDRDAGILAVKRHLRGPNNRASLFVMDNCRRTLYEIEGYMWEKDSGRPVDADDHAMENLYRLCLLDTRYVAPEEEFAFAGPREHTRNKVTGY